jgi:hypothetical protein
MALIIHTIRELGVEVVVESGRARGQSTYMLAKYLPNCKIYSIEHRDSPDEEFARKRLKKFENVELHMGSCSDAIKKALDRHTAKYVAILMDGPKGLEAVNILARSFIQKNVLVGFIHDMRLMDHGGPSPHRAAAVDKLYKCAFSDTLAITQATSWMDAQILAAGGPCGPEHEAEFGSYGPTVCVALNSLGVSVGNLRINSNKLERLRQL